MVFCGNRKKKKIHDHENVDDDDDDIFDDYKYCAISFFTLHISSSPIVCKTIFQ